MRYRINFYLQIETFHCMFNYFKSQYIFIILLYIYHMIIKEYDSVKYIISMYYINNKT